MKPGQEELDRLDEAVKKLRSSYEKYFIGVDRVEPAEERTKLKKRLREMTSRHINNTAWRFRLQSLQATVVTYEQYWNRVTRMIEEGTYHRHKARAQWRAKTSGSDPSTSPATPVAAEQPKPTPKAAAAKTAADPYAASLRQLHSSYIKAKKSVGDRTPVSIDALAKTLKQQYRLIKERYQCETVEFRVAVKDGKAVLKAIPK